LLKPKEQRVLLFSTSKNLGVKYEPIYLDLVGA
jgi:hypothetical protein